MANTNCNPHQIPTGTISAFTRNHYFYGKLLTVSDFQLEQDYFIDKIRLNNQLLEGVGIIDGLEITNLNIDIADNKNVTFDLSAGHAIDVDGNIILVECTRNISVENDTEDKNNFYICIEYNECEQDSVPIAGDGSQCGDEECCYNRVRETYKVTIQDSASPCVHTTNCTKVENIDASESDDTGTKNIVLAVVTGGSIDVNQTKQYRCTIKSNEELQDILCNHLDTIANPNPHQIKHNDLPDMNGTDTSSPNDTKNKHVSNNDAKRWDSSIYKINTISPEADGNFSIKQGNNITINPITNGIEISANSSGGSYREINIKELKPGQNTTIEHKFNKYPVVDVYQKVTHPGPFIGTKDELINSLEIEGKSKEEIEQEIKSNKLADYARKHEVILDEGSTLKTVLERINENLPRRTNKFALSDKESLLQSSKLTKRLLNNLVVMRISTFIVKGVDEKGNLIPKVMIRHQNRNEVIIHNTSNEITLNLLVILNT